MSGASIAFGALLLIIPGFFTDIIGFSLLIPVSRKILFKLILKKNIKPENTIKNDKIIDGEVINKQKEKDEL